MGLYFTAEEVLEIAERIEHNGAAFYQRAGELAQSDDVRTLLLRLAKEEAGHEEVFARMRTTLNDAEKPLFKLDPSDEAAGYLQVLADLVLFPPGEDPATVIGSPFSCRQVLLTAVQKERDSVAYYAGMRQIVPKTFGKMKVDAILLEEMRHVTRLAKELAALKE